MNQGLNRSIKNNEIKALFFIEKNFIFKAEKILLRNLRSGSANVMTFDLLIRIYYERDDYSSMIKILDLAIEKTPESSFYRSLKKQAILTNFQTNLEWQNHTSEITSIKGHLRYLADITDSGF